MNLSSIANRSAWMVPMTGPEMDFAAIFPEIGAAAPGVDFLIRFSVRIKGEATWRRRFHYHVRAVPATN